jgi:hypothetical protein
MPHNELQAVHAATGGHPMAMRLLQQLVEQGSGSEIDYAALRKKSISAVLDDLIGKIILKLPIRDQEHLARLSIFNRSFATAEASVVIEGLAPRFALDNLFRKGILQFNGDTFSIHDALRSVAQTMLRPNDAANLHLNMGGWYQTQVLEEFNARKEVTYELGFKWAHHTDAAHQLGQSIPHLSQLFELTDEAIAALWDIQRYGHPSDFSGADLRAMFHLTFPAAITRFSMVKEIGHAVPPFRRAVP